MIRLISFLLIGLLLAACGKHPDTLPTQAHIGPYTHFDGRLIVMEPNRRWQVSAHWQAEDEGGTCRLVHAMSGRIIDVRWQGAHIEMRDNQAADSEWHPVSKQVLSDHGIVLPPQMLSHILQGKLPAFLQAHGPNQWQGMYQGSMIQLQWQPEKQRLTIADIKHGRRASLLINQP